MGQGVFRVKIDGLLGAGNSAGQILLAPQNLAQGCMGPGVLGIELDDLPQNVTSAVQVTFAAQQVGEIPGGAEILGVYLERLAVGGDGPLGIALGLQSVA